MSEPSKGVSPRADLIGALAWMAFGITIVVASWRMERLEQFGATLYTAPGLVPGILGAAILLLGVVLLSRSMRRGAIPALRTSWAATADNRAAFRRGLTVTALALVYTLGFFGRMPFWLGTVLFVFGFMLVFDLPERLARGQAARGLVIAAITAVATTIVVMLVFERIFLVRLP